MSGDTQVGSIVAYLVLRREDWSAGVRDTERDAERLGRLSPTIRIQTNTGEVLGQLALVHAAERKVGTSAAEAKPFVMNLWAALAAVAPAAVPIAAVAGGALLGLVPVAATVALGISGVKAEMKSGQLAGTQYATDLQTVQSWLAQLKATAASGILDGVDQAVQQSKPLFGALNQDIGVMSTQLGDIVGGAAPALLSILHQLEPLFASIGKVVSDGAHALEHWAQSSNGISGFVAYVQTQLPEVEHLIGGVIELISHLLQGSAGSGSAILHDLNLLVHALDSIPVGVLATAIPLAISFYAALKTGQGVSAIVNAISRAVTSTGEALQLTGPKAEAAAAQQEAAAAQAAAATKAEAAAIAASAADEAEAMQAKQAEARAWGAAYDETVAQVAAAARLEAEAMAASAAAAEEAAAVKMAAAQTSAAAAEESAVASSAGFTGMLGPLAAVGIGVALLTTLFAGNSQKAQQDQASINDYTQALIQSKGAIDSSVRGTIAKQLADAGAFKAADQLGISTKTVTDAFLGNAQAATGLNLILLNGGDGSRKQQDAATHLADLLAQQTGNFATSRKAALDYLTAMGQASTATATQTAAIRTHASQLHTTVAAYTAAADAAKKNTDQTAQQTLAFQLENNAAGLLNQALATLAGQNLSVAQAQTALGQSVHSVTDSMHTNGTAIRGSSVAALANQQAIEGNVSAARQLATAVAQQTGSNDKAAASYKRSKTALEDQLRAHGELTPAVKRYIDRLYDVKGISDYLSAHPTKIDVQNESATAKLRAMQRLLNDIANGHYVAHVSATGSVHVAGANQSGGVFGGNFASGTGSGGLPDGYSWVGDPGPNSELVHKRGSQVDVYSHADSMRIASMMGMNVPAYASGTKSAKGPTSTQVSNVDQAAATLESVSADMSASASSVRSAATALDKSARAAGLSQAALASVAADQSHLSRDAAARERLAARLGTAPSAPTAYDRLAAAQGQYNSDRDKYRAALLGFDITSTTPAGPTTASRQVGGATVTTTTPGSGQVTAASIIAAGGADVAQVKEFDHLIHKLVAEGLDADYVAQIAGKGPQAIDTARALAKATPAQVRALNSQEKQRKSSANDLGTYLAKQYDQAGVHAAQGLINGLKSQEKQLTAEMEHIAVHMVKVFDKKLRINSPSQEFDDRGGHVVQGLVNGSQRKLHLIRSTAQDMADAMLGGFARSGAAGAATAGQGGVQVVVQPRANHSEQQIGRAVADEMLWQLRR